MAKRVKKEVMKLEIIEDKKAPIKVFTDALKKIELTSKQKELIKIIDTNDIIIVKGPAGTSKTFIDCYYAIQCIASHKYKEVIMTKPIQEAGERVGFLKGTLEDKIDPFYDSFKQNIIKLVGKETTGKLFEKESIQFKPLAFMRGSSFEDTLMVGDEFQNCSWKQVMLFVTRMGTGSKVIISGDINQYDISKDMMALLQFTETMKDIKGIAVFEFTSDDIMRHGILKEITERYEKLKYSGKIKEEK